MAYDLSKVMKIVDRNSDRVVIEVKSDDPLTTAMYPFIPGNTAYITVTLGDNHVLTVVKKNNSTFSFHWGIDGYTLVSESLEQLRREVVKFLECKGIRLR